MAIDVKPYPNLHGPPSIKPSTLGTLSLWIKTLWENVNSIRSGKLSCVFYKELDSAGSTTVIIHPLLTKQSVLVLNPVNAAAAGMWTSIYAAEADRADGQWTLTHDNTTGLGTTAFMIAIIG